MSRARDLADSADKDIVGTLTVDGLTVAGNVSVDGGTIKLDGNYPVGTGNVALGDAALDDASLTGSGIVAIGNYALSANTSGISNTAVGRYSLLTNSTGSYNTAYGFQSLFSNTTASNNTAVGYQAGYSNTTGTKNTCIGDLAGYTNSTSSGNTFIGRRAGYFTTGTSNTFIGHEATYNSGAGELVTTGSRNTIIGAYNGNQGGLDIRTSSNNIVLSDGDGNPRLYIDSGGDVSVETFSNTGASRGFEISRSENSNVCRLLSSVTTASNVAIGVFANPNGVVGSIRTTGSSTVYSTSSDYRLKENVVAMSGATERLKQLNPVRFNFIADADTTVDGFLAHEAQAVVPEAVHGTKDEVDNKGNPVYQGIDQSKLVPLLVATIQELEARITALESA